MLILEFEEHRTNEEGKEIFESCDWWKELVSKAAQDADRFEVRCWEDEQEGIAFGQQYGQKQESSTKEIVFAGELTGQALSVLVDDCVGADGVLKYFTLNLYASEIYWMKDSFAEIGFLMMMTKKYPLIKGFDKR